MKKLVIVLILSITALQLNAQPEYRPKYPGVLQVRLSDDYPITIALDGRYFEKHGPSLTVGDLPPGKHFLKIYTFTPNGDRDAKAHLVYEGKVRIYDEGVTSLVFDQNTGEMHINRGDEGYAPRPEQERVRGRLEEPFNPPAGNNQQIDTVPAIKAPEKVIIPTAKLSKPSYPQISKDALNKLGNKINAKITDTDKLKELQVALAKKAMSTEQVKLIMTWLNFESSRVDFAKWAFANTTDKQNYTTISDGMKYQESKDDLNDFLMK